MLSYITGWLNLLGNAAADAAFAWGFASLVAAASSESSSPLANGGTGIAEHAPLSVGAQAGIAIAVLLAWALINLFRIDHQGWFNNCEFCIL